MRPRNEQQHPTRRPVPLIRNQHGSSVVSQPVAGNQRHGMRPAGAHCRDWSTAGRIEGGQSAPRFGSVARNPLTGLGSNAWPVQFLTTIRDHLLPVADSGNGILPLGRSRAHSDLGQYGVHRLADRHPVLIDVLRHAANLSQA